MVSKQAVRSVGDWIHGRTGTRGGRRQASLGATIGTPRTDILGVGVCGGRCARQLMRAAGSVLEGGQGWDGWL